MKKFVALILAVVLVLSFSVSALALKSPGGTIYFEVIVNRTNQGESNKTDEVINVKENGELELVPVVNEEKEFEGWEFYDADMKPAEIGKDFEIVKVTKKDGSEAIKGIDYEIVGSKVVPKAEEYINVVIKPLVDRVIVNEAFKGVKPNVVLPSGDVLSPVTGMSTSVVMMLVAAILGGAALMVVSRKKVNA